MNRNNNFSSIFLNKNSMYFLRGICMILIILHHINIANNISFDNKFINIFLGNQGYLSTGTFFLLSGYGLTISLNKNSPIHWNYLINRISKMLYIFIFCYFICFICMLICGFKFSYYSILNDILTLSMPDSPTWFLKTIVLLYILYISSRIYLSPKNSIIFTSLLIILYTIIAFYKLPGYYYNSIANFALGTLLVYYKEKIIRHRYIIIVLAIILFSIGFFYFQILSSLSYSILIIIFFSYIRIENKVINYIGINSLGFYLGQFLPLKIAEFLPHNKLLYTFIFFIITIITVVAYNKIKELSYKKYKFI